MFLKSLIQPIAGRIWAAWILLVFTGTMILFLIPFLSACAFLKEPARTHRFILLSRPWMAVFLWLIGCPLRIRGREHFERGKRYIVVCNHNSFMDIPVSSPSIPGGNKTIAKAELARIPLFGLIYRAGSVLVDRKSEKSRKESYLRMKEVLDMGLHMCIYPEGSRNRTGKPLKAFHSGAFRLALDTGTPIVPAVILHTAKVLPANRWFYAMPHPLAIHFLPPVEHLPGESADELSARVHRIMESFYLAQMDISSNEKSGCCS